MMICHTLPLIPSHECARLGIEGEGDVLQTQKVILLKQAGFTKPSENNHVNEYMGWR
jgi:hypothetical protein